MDENEECIEEHNVDESEDISERILNKCMPGKLDTEEKIKRMLE